jgi:hypothetical protein
MGFNCKGAAAHRRRPKKRATSGTYRLNWEHVMAEEEKMDRKPPASRIRGMSLYASSADYERRLSEDFPQGLEPDIVDETQVDGCVGTT